MDTHNANAQASPGMTFTDKMFVLFLVFVLAMVCWLGVLNYQEGSKTEASKRNGEAWMAWLAEAGAHRFEADYVHKACAGGIKPNQDPSKTSEAVPGTWGACVKYLLEETELKELRNPFHGELPQFAAACDPHDRSLNGALVLEDLTPTPAGSPIPFVASQLIDTDPIDAKLQVRVTICDKGSEPIKIGEIEF
jgi:hypothetical protein